MSVLLDLRCLSKGVCLVNPADIAQGLTKDLSTDESIQMSSLPRKPSTIRSEGSVPQTDTGGWGEKPKVNGSNLVKELGKTASVS